jgi:predicted transcriptional regulator
MPTKVSLPPAERDVLACLRQQGQATARQLREALHKLRPMTHGSVATLLKRLESKGLVTKQKGPEGKAFLYQASRATDPTLGHMVRDLVQRVFQGNPLSLVASLFESQPPTAAEAKELRRMLDELRQQKGKKP